MKDENDDNDDDDEGIYLFIIWFIQFLFKKIKI